MTDEEYIEMVEATREWFEARGVTFVHFSDDDGMSGIRVVGMTDTIRKEFNDLVRSHVDWSRVPN